MRTHLFPNVALEDLESAEDQGNELEDRLTKSLDTTAVAFTLLWTRGINVQIASLQYRTQGTSWREALTQRWTDDDGEFSHPLGLFSPGTRIQVMVVAMAMDADVPRAAAAVSVQPGGRVTQIIPAPPVRSEPMQRGFVWAREGMVTV